MRGLMMDFPLSVNHFLERAGTIFANQEIASRRPDRTVVRITYRDFQRRAKQLASALKKLGIQRGDRVATLMWNHAGHLEAYFGIPAAGAVVHPLNLRLHPDEIAFVANHARDRVLIVDDILLPTLERFRGKTKFETIIVVPFGGCMTGMDSSYKKYEEFLSSGSADFHPADVDENDAAAMCFTSGTTGQSKGVLYSHRALALHSLAVAIPDVMDLSIHSVVFPVSPMFHANAWGMPWASVMVGAKLIFPGPLADAESVLDTMVSEGATHSCGVPTVWMGVQAAIEKEPSRWKFSKPVKILCGGMAPPSSLIRSLDAANLHIVHGWGMTETTPVATVGMTKPKKTPSPPEQQLEQRAMQGIAVPFVETRITRPEGEAPHDGVTPGEVEIRGPWIASSYFESPDQKHRWTEDGWFKTGDIATMDSEECLRIVDRSKDLIKSGGEWISSVDLENALAGHPAIREAAVVGVPHPKWQERPLAIVVLKEGASPSAGELREFLSQRFAKWQLPDAFVFVDELPHTSVGKLLKMKLRETYRTWDWKRDNQVR